MNKYISLYISPLHCKILGYYVRPYTHRNTLLKRLNKIVNFNEIFELMDKHRGDIIISGNYINKYTTHFSYTNNNMKIHVKNNKLSDKIHKILYESHKCFSSYRYAAYLHSYSVSLHSSDAFHINIINSGIYGKKSLKKKFKNNNDEIIKIYFDGLDLVFCNETYKILVNKKIRIKSIYGYAHDFNKLYENYLYLLKIEPSFKIEFPKYLVINRNNRDNRYNIYNFPILKIDDYGDKKYYGFKSEYATVNIFYDMIHKTKTKNYYEISENIASLCDKINYEVYTLK